MVRSLSLILLMFLAHSVGASAPDPLPAERLAPGEFDQLLAEVRRDLAPVGRHADLGPDRSAVLEAALTDIQGLLGDVDSLDRLSPEAQLELVNAYHRVNAALAEGEYDPIVCRRLLKTGSKFKKVACAYACSLRERVRMEKDAIVAAVAAPRQR